MPGRNRTGPMGAGPMTGRGLGYCNVGRSIGLGSRWRAASPGLGFGRGLGRGMGRLGGFGYASSYRASAHAEIPTDQVDELRVQADELRAALADIERRLSEAEME